MKQVKPINITSLIEKYGPGYVATNKITGKIVAHATRVDILMKKIKDKEKIIISWVPKYGARYVFNLYLLYTLKSSLWVNFFIPLFA